ncbi:DoxX family protein [Streptomyces asiaticus]
MLDPRKPPLTPRNTLDDTALLILRLAVGGLLVIHGFQGLGDPAHRIALSRGFGVPFPEVASWLSILGEILRHGGARALHHRRRPAEPRRPVRGMGPVSDVNHAGGGHSGCRKGPVRAGSERAGLSERGLIGLRSCSPHRNLQLLKASRHIEDEAFKYMYTCGQRDEE